MPTYRGQQLAEDHWDWLGGLIKKVYIDAFVHGYKHGVDDYGDEDKADH